MRWNVFCSMIGTEDENCFRCNSLPLDEPNSLVRSCAWILVLNILYISKCVFIILIVLDDLLFISVTFILPFFTMPIFSLHVRFHICNIIFRDYLLSRTMLFSSRDGVYVFPSESYDSGTRSTTFKDLRQFEFELQSLGGLFTSLSPLKKKLYWHIIDI